MSKREVLKKLQEVQEVKNRVVKSMVLDDVCDTGNIYLKIRELPESLGAEQVSLVVLVDKV